MKRIIPIILISGTGLLLSGCSKMSEINPNRLKDNLNTFKSSATEYFNLRNSEPTKTVLSKYMVNIEDEFTEHDTTKIDQLENIPVEKDSHIENEISSENTEIISDTNDTISTYYTLTKDIEDSCDEFCELKQDITTAIIETENLLQKIQTKEISLDAEQRIFLQEQVSQLKNLSRELSRSTANLSFQLSSLEAISFAETNSIDDVNLKYLMLLNSIINDNEVLSNGLMSLNLINQMANINKTYSTGNNTGRILYGFQKNNEPPIIKDYTITEDGELQENMTTEDKDSNTLNDDSTESKKSNIDSYTNTNLVSNIDTYGNRNQNIDSFFNTALLDNEFMYGNNFGAYGNNFGRYGNGLGFNPSLNQYAMYEKNNQYINDHDINQNNNIEKNYNNENLVKNNEISDKNTKKFKISKNIDTYRDEKTPDLKTRFNKIKSSFNNIFIKINPSDDHIKNPIFYLDNLKN